MYVLTFLNSSHGPELHVDHLQTTTPIALSPRPPDFWLDPTHFEKGVTKREVLSLPTSIHRH